MTLKQYYGKVVRITAINGIVFYGIVDDYFYPDENENGLESIVLNVGSGGLYEFTVETIAEIVII